PLTQHAAPPNGWSLIGDRRRPRQTCSFLQWRRGTEQNLPALLGGDEHLLAEQPLGGRKTQVHPNEERPWRQCALGGERQEARPHLGGGEAGQGERLERRHV